MKNLPALSTICGPLLVIDVHAHGRAVSRYQVSELPAPDSLRAGCVEDYSAGAADSRINDFGVNHGNFTGCSQVDPRAASFHIRGATFATATRLGAAESAQSAEPGFDTEEPMTKCLSVNLDPVTGTSTLDIRPCHNTHMHVLTPVGR